MTSNRYSKLTTLGLLLVLAIAAVAPAMAVSVDDSSVPGEAEAGSQISASVTLDDLYQNPQWEPWTLEGETELQNVTWTLTFVDASGNEFDTASYDGQQFNQTNVSSDNDILGIRVEVTGVVPEPATGELTYPEEETFTAIELTQTRGEEGSMNEIETVETHHYTTGDGEDPGSREARQALDDARAAIQDAQAGDADTSEAENTLQSAISSYENGNFANAIGLAETSQDEANSALDEKEASEQQTQLLMFGGAALVVVLLVAGGFWWYRQQQGDDYDKLG